MTEISKKEQFYLTKVSQVINALSVQKSLKEVMQDEKETVQINIYYQIMVAKDAETRHETKQQRSVESGIWNCFPSNTLCVLVRGQR